MQMSFDFSDARRVRSDEASNDYHRLPVSEKQVLFARQIAARNHVAVPDDALGDRKRLSEWIDANKGSVVSRLANYPSSKQVAFAERIARIKRRSVPEECFKDRKMMSRWIDSNR